MPIAIRSEIKPDERGLALRIAMGAMRAANSAATSKAGSVYIPNGDGTGTLIGELAGTDGTGGANGVAPWVGDSTPPGKPSGITCSSAWGTLYVSWDGTLEGGVPADFAYVSVLVDGQEIERLACAGTAVREDLENGSTVQVSAVAYDAARDSLGNQAPNASQPWGPVSVAISDERAEIDAEVEQIRQDAEEMGAKVDKVAGDAAEALEKAQETVEQVTADVAEAKKAAQEASDKADGYAQQIADATASVNGVKQDVSELSTKVEGAVEDAEGALTAATEAKQTATEVSTTATRAYEDAQSALTQSSQAVQTATSVKTTLETDYVSKADASATYTAKSEFEATSSKLTASITEAAKPAEAAQDKALEVEATASGLKTTITQVSSKADSAQKDADAAQSTADGAVKQVTSLEATVDGVSSAVTKAQSTADSAVSAASKAQQTVDGFKTEVSQKYQPKGDYASKGDLSGYQPKGDYATKSSVEQTATQIRQQVADTYATKTALDQERTDRQSAITQSATQVKSEVSSTYLKKTDASSTYATKASLSSYATKSSVDQTASQIKSEVAATYATQKDVDGISVGGTNLLLGTSYKNLSHVTVRGNYGMASIDNSDTVGSRTSLKLVTTQAGASGTKDVMHDLVPKLENKKVVVSFWVKGSVAASMMVRIGGGYTAGSTAMDKAVTTSWKRVVLEMGPLSGNGSSENYVIIAFNKAGTFRVSGMKCEYGNKPTDWSPAPEDMLSTADAAATYATKTALTQTEDSITAEVAKTYQSKSGMASYATKSYVDQQDSSIKSTVSSVQKTADSALTKATTVEQTADGLEVKIDSAVTTANTAKSTADSAKSTATTANNTANSAKSTATAAQNTANAAKKQVYHSASGTSVTAGYVRFATVKFTQTYMNRPLFFALSNRGQAQSNVWVQWNNVNSTDPSLASIKSDGGINVWAHKTGTSAWEIIAQKSGVYDTIYVNDHSNNNSGCTVSWVNVQLSSVPSGSTQATRLAGKRNSADIDNAAKTATNYLKFDSSGLCVGNMTGTLGYNTLTKSTGVDIRNGSTVLSSFGASQISLGQNSSSSQIKMCGNQGTFYVNSGVFQMQGSSNVRVQAGAGTAYVAGRSVTVDSTSGILSLSSSSSIVLSSGSTNSGIYLNKWNCDIVVFHGMSVLNIDQYGTKSVMSFADLTSKCGFSVGRYNCALFAGTSDWAAYPQVIGSYTSADSIGIKCVSGGNQAVRVNWVIICWP